MIVILKNDLKGIPIIGWCMQLCLYIFLQVEEFYRHNLYITVLLLCFMVEYDGLREKKRMMYLILPASCAT